MIEREECPEHGDTLTVTTQRHPLRYCVTCSDFITPLRRRYVPHEALATAIVGGVEVAGKVRDANRAERRRLEAENRRLREAVAEARDLVAEAYSDDEDNDSPGNMAFAVLNHALEQSR